MLNTSNKRDLNGLDGSGQPLRDEGVIPKVNRNKTQIYSVLNAELNDRLTLFCRKRSISKASAIKIALHEYLVKNET